MAKNGENRRIPYVTDARRLQKFLSKILREVYSGRLSCERGRALATIANSLRATMETADLEERIVRLEGEMGKWQSSSRLRRD